MVGSAGAALLGGAAWLAKAAAGSETLKWGLGLLFVVGGSIVAAGHLYRPADGTVVSIQRVSRDGQPLLLAPVEVTFADEDGGEARATSWVSNQYGDFHTLGPGDEVKLLVCRSNPDVVKINGMPLLRGTCEAPGTKTDDEP